ncbi:hypothetical protein C6B38_02760 [Spiroplasma sp. ChiS]|uniref:hypothetical protein n=1 Tax=Spiroplasma sp. ChiS TaxID=2099885 RepID=UPI000CFA4236|nr:hypothetical protein [Spiroplasma sp. ChiS]PQP79010.1 hypothetical protein C6B38_02760 [Spiroplasma sp. ChiS]
MKKILNLMGTISITFSGIIPLIGMTSNYENKITENLKTNYNKIQIKQEKSEVNVDKRKNKIKFNKYFDLKEIIKITNLISIVIDPYDNFSSEEQIKDRIKQLNPRVDISKIKVTNITTKSAKVTSNDINIYNGNLKVKYNCVIRLRPFISNQHLGEIKTNGTDIPSEEQIKDRIKQLNPRVE